jgi:GrpB-like predicted nucleotidyltransferase (UPF0157 family)
MAKAGDAAARRPRGGEDERGGRFDGRLSHLPPRSRREPAWIERLHKALAPLEVRIEHDGSTAVPGLSAKPVIDLQVSVPSIADKNGYRPALESLGLVLRARAPDDRFFRPTASAPRTVHVHVCERGSAWERDHILFRDLLRVHPSAATAGTRD